MSPIECCHCSHGASLLALSMRIVAILIPMALLIGEAEPFQLHLSRTNQVKLPRLSNSRPFRPLTISFMGTPSFYNDDEDDDDDDLIDPDTLGDWRTFRRNLAWSNDADNNKNYKDDNNNNLLTPSGRPSSLPPPKSVSAENEEMLASQNEELAREYRQGVWAHEVATPEVGGLVVRLPLEVELFRNHRHSISGRKLRLQQAVNWDNCSTESWYKKAQTLVEREMQGIAEKAGDEGEVDASTLDEDTAEILQLYLDNQETWQEVCLVLEKDDETGTATTLILNRPMALKLTESLGQLILFGAYRTLGTKKKPLVTTERDLSAEEEDFFKLMLAFGQECAVYIGGPDHQDQPAELIHGVADLPGATEIYPGAGIFRGGIPAAVDGVLLGKYKPLDFRFFIGCHDYDESTLDVFVRVGKYQPIACARSLVLKQCLSLPKPLWHEVLEICGGELSIISQLEWQKRNDDRYHFVDDDEYEIIDDEDDDDDDDDDEEDDEDEDEIINELGELERFDDEDDEDEYRLR